MHMQAAGSGCPYGPASRPLKHPAFRIPHPLTSRHTGHSSNWEICCRHVANFCSDCWLIPCCWNCKRKGLLVNLRIPLQGQATLKGNLINWIRRLHLIIFKFLGRHIPNFSGAMLIIHATLATKGFDLSRFPFNSACDYQNDSCLNSHPKGPPAFEGHIMSYGRVRLQV